MLCESVVRRKILKKKVIIIIQYKHIRNYYYYYNDILISRVHVSVPRRTDARYNAVIAKHRIFVKIL